MLCVLNWRPLKKGGSARVSMLYKMTDDLAYCDEIKLEPMEHIKASSSASRLCFKRTSACLNEIVSLGKLLRLNLGNI